jgi:hypothetical protein
MGDMGHGEVESFLGEWKRELEAASERAREAGRPNPVVWEGELDGQLLRVRRLDEHSLLTEQAVSGGLHSEGSWAATDDGTAMRAYERAYLEALGGRGLK